MITEVNLKEYQRYWVNYASFSISSLIINYEYNNQTVGCCTITTPSIFKHFKGFGFLLYANYWCCAPQGHFRWAGHNTLHFISFLRLFDIQIQNVLHSPPGHQEVCRVPG